MKTEDELWFKICQNFNCYPFCLFRIYNIVPLSMYFKYLLKINSTWIVVICSHEWFKVATPSLVKHWFGLYFNTMWTAEHTSRLHNSSHYVFFLVCLCLRAKRSRHNLTIVMMDLISVISLHRPAVKEPGWYQRALRVPMCLFVPSLF